MSISSLSGLNTCESLPAGTQKRDKREAIRMFLKAKGLNPLCCPKWLKDLSATDIVEGKLPLLKILKGSLYYPACNIDGGPIKYFGHYVQSFCL